MNVYPFGLSRHGQSLFEDAATAQLIDDLSDPTGKYGLVLVFANRSMFRSQSLVYSTNA
jgi:hypothetical protein